MRSRRRIAIALIAIVALGAALRLALPLFGTFLVVQDPLIKADAIVVLAGGRIGRTYEAGLLFRKGIAPLIVLSHPDDSGHHALAGRLGIRIPSDFDLQMSALTQMGIPREAIRELPGRPVSTADEAVLLSQMASATNLKSIVVVSSPYHMRRARLYLRDAARGQYRIAMRGSSFEGVRPERWWRQPFDRTDVVLEWMKLPVCVWRISA